jgi:Phosphodiester glycosidase
LLTGVLLTTGLLAGVGTVQAVASPGITTTTKSLGPGISLTKIYDPSGPTHIYVLTLTPAPGLSARTVLAGGMGSYAPTSQIASSHGAVAAINADFTVDPGRPMHSFGMGGDLTQIGRAGTMFGFSSDLRHKAIVQGRPTSAFQNLTTKARFPISDFNSGDPSNGDLVAYTTYGQSGGIQPPSNACSARLGHPTKVHWASHTHVGLYRDWVVKAVACRVAPLSVQKGTIVLSAGMSGAGSRAIRALKPKKAVRVSWSLGRSGVDETVAGMPELVTNGVDTAPASRCNSYFCSPNARTAIGVTSAGKVLLVVVDGQQRGWSNGLSLWQLGKEMIKLGARYAVNLDGSGGSTMWVKGQGVINRPSDWSGERPVTSALLVMRGSTQLAPLPFVKVK